MANVKDGNLLPSFESESWRSWTPRPELSPAFAKEQINGQHSLVISSADGFRTYGCWHCEAEGVQGNTAYEITVACETSGVHSEAVSVNAIATWKNREGDWVGREYIDEYADGTADSQANDSAASSAQTDSAKPTGLRSVLAKTVQAPAGAVAVKLELEFRWAAGGTVRFEHAGIVPAQTAVGQRKAKLVTTYVHPYHDDRSNLEGNLQELIDTLELAGRHRPDLVCLSETLYARSAGFPVEQIAQPLDGEVINRIRRKTREIGAYVVFNFYERTDGGLHNTSLLIGRDGEIAGIYRKTHLPMAEAQAGVTPGNDYPVFDTDFGKVGLLVCWDQMFPETARALRLKGAEIICISTAGEARIQQLARAVDNGLYVVVAGINGDIVRDAEGYWISDPEAKPSRIIAPSGKVLGEIGHGEGGILCAEVDLNEKFLEMFMSVGPTFGETRSLYLRERRPETYRYE